MIKIIVSAVLILFSIFIYVKLSAPVIANLKAQESTSMFLKQKITVFNGQIARLKKTKPTDVILKKQKISTYMFTLLSFVNYLKSEGTGVNIKLSRTGGAAFTAAKNAAPTKLVPVPAGNVGFLPYETNTKFNGVKKIGITLIFKGYPGINSVLSIMNKLYVLFPISFTDFKMNDKFTTINFNLYSFKGV